jgi:predicted SAM-dependent methyltransferase
MKLHLGCGPVRLDGWTNVDLDSDAADLTWDLRQPLPYPSGSVEAIFSEHFIEHIAREEAVAFLSRCRDLLVPGGTIRVTTPDLRWVIAMYLAGETSHWHDVGWFPASPCQLLNEGMRAWGHQWCYDADDLGRLFEQAGFRNVGAASYRESAVAELRNLESRPYHHELIFEATKEVGSPDRCATGAHHADDLVGRLAAIEASTSWRLTAPLRRAVGALRRR